MAGAGTGPGLGGRTAATASATGSKGRGPARTDSRARTDTAGTCAMEPAPGQRRATRLTARGSAGSEGTASSPMCAPRRAAGSQLIRTLPAAARRVAGAGIRGARWGARAPTTAQPEGPRAMHVQAWVAWRRAEPREAGHGERHGGEAEQRPPERSRPSMKVPTMHALHDMTRRDARAGTGGEPVGGQACVPRVGKLVVRPNGEGGGKGASQ